MSEADRLRWRCRRGTLELDLILARFLDEHYLQLPPAEQQAFEDLLQSQDDVLMAMITGDEALQEQRFNTLIERLRLC